MLGMNIDKTGEQDFNRLHISIFDYMNDYSDTLVHFVFVNWDENDETIEWKLQDLKLSITAATTLQYTNILQSALWTFANKQLTDPFDVIRWAKNSNIKRIEIMVNEWIVSDKDPLLSETW